MAINNFIPTVWSETLCQELDKTYVGIANCSREYEGDILEKGNKVRICGISPVSIGNYTKNSNISTPDSLSDFYTELEINQAKYFNFQIDDIDRAQGNPRVMEVALKSAANALASEAEKYVYNLIGDAANCIRNITPTPENIIDTIINARTHLLKAGVTDPSDIVVEVSPEIAGLILKAKVQLSTDNTDVLENGCIGSIAGCKIFASPFIPVVEDTGVLYACCVARTRRAIAFAEQLSEIEAYRPENRFSDAMKGLHLYGAKVIHPQEMVSMIFGISNLNLDGDEL